MEYSAVIKNNKLVLHWFTWRDFHDAFWNEKQGAEK